MPNFNQVILMGNLTRDPELRYLPTSNTALASFGVAVNRTWKNQAGEKQEEVTFIDCEAWAKTAEVICKYMANGAPIHLTGRLKLDQWEDKKDGSKRSKLKVVVESFQFLPDGRQRGEVGDEAAQVAPAGKPATRRPEPAPSLSYEGPTADEDIPF